MEIIKKIKTMDKVTKASIAYVLVAFFQKGITVISGPIFTRILSVNEYGILSVYNSWFEMIGVLTMLSLSSGVYNNGLLEFKDDRNIFTYSLLILSNIATISVAIFFLICQKIIIKLFAMPTSLIYLMFLCYLFMPAMSFWIARQRYEYKYKLSCIVTAVSTFLAVCVSVIFTYIISDNKVIMKLWSEKIVFFLFWIVLYSSISIKAKFKINLSYWKYALSFTLPLIPHYLANYILNGIDRIMILNMIGKSSAAIYAVAYSAAFMVQIFWQSINAAILPLTYENIKAGNYKNIEKVVLPYVCVYGCLCIVVSFIAPEIMYILAPSEYRDGQFLIPILTVGVFLTGLYCLFANVEFYYRSTKPIAANSIIAAILNIFLNYIFIKYYGYKTAAYTTLFCYMIQTLLHYRNYRKVSQKIYDEKKLLIIFGIVVIVNFAGLPLYEYRLVRYLLLLVMGFIAIIFWKKASKVISE